VHRMITSALTFTPFLVKTVSPFTFVSESSCRRVILGLLSAS
jgi:hypothetical protein